MDLTKWKFIAAIVTPIVLIGSGFAAGRYSAPEKVTEKEVFKDRIVTVEKIDEKQLSQLTEQINFALNQLSQLKKSIHKEKTSTTYPDGRVEAKEVVDINVEKTVQTTEVREVTRDVVVVQEKVVTVDRIVEKEVLKEKVTEAPKPQWKVSPLVGVNIRDLSLGQGLTTGPLAFGVKVDRRIVGPVFLGAWGISSGQAGLSVGMEF